MAYILVTRTEASKAISVKLKRILEGIRLANSLSVIEKLYQEERKIFDKVSSNIKTIYKNRYKIINLHMSMLDFVGNRTVFVNFSCCFDCRTV